jgi:hypothetical protein
MRSFALVRAEVAQRGVATFAVPESFDILKQAGLGLLGVGLATLVCQFHFQSAERTLGHGVVPAFGSTASTCRVPAEIVVLPL